MSCPARGTWIEIAGRSTTAAPRRCRAPQGARGLKYGGTIYEVQYIGRAPQGARGLKCLSGVLKQTMNYVVPRKGHVD